MDVSIIGAGLIGGRRAQAAVAAGDRVAYVFDPDAGRRASLAAAVGARVANDADGAIEAAEIVVIATPNKFLAPLAIKALQADRHVLIEKPMGRDLPEAKTILAAARAAGGPVFKVGFNHRYHPAIVAARELVAGGGIGKPMFVRAVYGHGGRPGYEREWRGSRDLAGGGELTDQGVHLLDLFAWFLGRPDWAFAQRRTCAWPLGNLEDNAFALLGWHDGGLAQMHTSWTQWKNRFSFQVYGTDGSAEVEGLGGSYGEETLIISRRRPEGGSPKTERTPFPGPDESWQREWSDFRRAIREGIRPMGDAEEGVNVMAALAALYASCMSRIAEDIKYPEPA